MGGRGSSPGEQLLASQTKVLSGNNCLRIAFWNIFLSLFPRSFQVFLFLAFARVHFRNSPSFLTTPFSLAFRKKDQRCISCLRYCCCTTLSVTSHRTWQSHWDGTRLMLSVVLFVSVWAAERATWVMERGDVTLIAGRLEHRPCGACRSSVVYMKIWFLPHSKHNPSQLQRTTG